jgi:hypothetical protein
MTFVQRNFSTFSNAWRRESYGWGNRPQNLRPSMFNTLVELNKTYTIVYTGSPPTSSQYRMQKRIYPQGKPGDWAIFEIDFIPNQNIDVYSVDSNNISQIVDPLNNLSDLSNNQF